MCHLNKSDIPGITEYPELQRSRQSYQFFVPHRTTQTSKSVWEHASISMVDCHTKGWLLQKAGWGRKPNSVSGVQVLFMESMGSLVGLQKRKRSSSNPLFRASAGGCLRLQCSFSIKFYHLWEQADEWGWKWSPQMEEMFSSSRTDDKLLMFIFSGQNGTGDYKAVA